MEKNNKKKPTCDTEPSMELLLAEVDEYRCAKQARQHFLESLKDLEVSEKTKDNIKNEK